MIKEKQNLSNLIPKYKKEKNDSRIVYPSEAALKKAEKKR